MRIKRKYYFYLMITVVITILVRLPFLKTWNLGVAPIEIFNVAKNFAESGKFILSIKANFFTDSSIVHSAVTDVTLLFTILVSALIKLGVGYGGIQVLNAFLATIVVSILFFMFSQFFGLNIAFWSSLLISLNPFFLRMSIIASDDIFFILIVVLVIFLFVRDSNRSITVMGLGILSGLTFIARDAGLLLILAFLIYYIFITKELRSFFIYLCSALLIVIPYLWFVSSENGSIVQIIALKIIKRSDYDRGIWLGYNMSVPPLLDYLKTNVLFLMRRNLGLLYSYLQTLVDFSYLSFLSIFLLCLKKVHFKNKKSYLLILYAIMNLFIFSTFINGSSEFRYLLPSFIFLIPFALFALKDLRIKLSMTKHGKINFYTGVVIIIVIIYVTKAFTSFIELDKENYFQPGHYKSLSEWVRQNSEKQENFAATVPWVFNLLTDRSTVTFPYLNSMDQLRDFIQNYQVAYLVVDTGFTPYGEHLPYGDMFINGLYQNINQASPMLLTQLLNETYYDENKEHKIYLFKVADLLLVN